jgi:adenosine kinase
VTIGIVAPNGRKAMIEHASQFAERGTSFMFDPGQGLPPVDGDDLCHKKLSLPEVIVARSYLYQKLSLPEVIVTRSYRYN